MKINPKESLTVTFSIDPSAMSSLPRIVFCFVLFFFFEIVLLSLRSTAIFPFSSLFSFTRSMDSMKGPQNNKATSKAQLLMRKQNKKKNQTKKSPFRNFPRRFAAVVLFFTEFCRVLPSFCECQVQLQKISSVLLLIYFFLPARLLSVFEWFGIDFSPVFTQMFSVHRPDFEQTIILTPPSNGSEQHIKKQ